jgi:hypothetical protein
MKRKGKGNPYYSWSVRNTDRVLKDAYTLSERLAVLVQTRVFLIQLEVIEAAGVLDWVNRLRVTFLVALTSDCLLRPRISWLQDWVFEVVARA